MLRATRSASLAAAMLLCAAAGVRAQQPDTARVVPIDTLPVRVLRTPLPPLRAPFAVTAVGGDAQRRAKPGLALDEALSTVAGVQVDNRFNYALGERISVRGFGARAQFGVRGVRVLLDGLPATLPDGQTTLNHVDVGSVARAEIIRGPAAALYGNASGGVIRLTSLAPPPVPIAWSSRVTAGEGGLLRAQTQAGGVAGAFGWRASFTQLGYDGFRQHQRADNSLGAASLAWARGADQVRLSFTGVHYDASNPGALNDTLLRADRSQAIANNIIQRAGEEGRQGQLGTTWTHALGTGGLEVAAYGLARSIDNPIPVRVIDLKRRVGGARAALSGALGPALRWTAGGEWETQRDDRRNFANQKGERGALQLDQLERVASLAGFAEATATAGPLDVLGAVRFDHFRFSVDDRLVSAGNPDDSGARTMQAWSPTLGASLAAARGVSVYANVSTAFETPTTTELANRPTGAGGFNPDLNPSRTLSWEGGVKARSGAAWAEAAAYRARIRDALVPFEVEGFAGRQFYRNAGSAVHRGVELSAGVRPLDGLTVRAAYTLTDARFGRYVVGGMDLEGNRVPGISPHRLDASAYWSRGRGPFAGVDARYASAVPVADDDAAQRWRSPARTLVDARGGWGELRLRGLRASPELGVTNLFDARYNASVVINAARRRYYEPGPGRSVYLGMEVWLGAWR